RQPQPGLAGAARGHVQHGADHAHDLAGTVADEVAAVLDLGPAAVGAAEAVGALPGLDAARQRALQAGGHHRRVLRVDQRLPGVEVRRDPLRRVADDVVEAVAPPRHAARHVPVVDGVAGGAGDDAEPQLRAGAFLLGADTVGDVLHQR